MKKSEGSKEYIHSIACGRLTEETHSCVCRKKNWHDPAAVGRQVDDTVERWGGITNICRWG